ncbi:MAG: glycoside hydrolase family 127 protein, partial [Candidatus Promineifilaceae bacterium]|nr:glycoside hydrolase family 127 protein [Candidatus Promineifilaceae bacterium]
TSKLWLRVNDSSDLVAFIYGPYLLETVVNGVTVAIEQDTQYPFAETITLKINTESAVEFGIHMRVPRWSVHTDVTAEGADLEVQDGYIVVRKLWQAGDEIRLIFMPQIRAVRNVNHEYTIRRGPLQFALPIAHKQEAIKSYAVSGFHDYNLTPRSVRDAYQIIFLDDGQENFGLSVIENKSADFSRPWDDSPLILKAGEHTLVPLGCTLLRRSTFPILDHKSSIADRPDA